MFETWSQILFLKKCGKNKYVLAALAATATAKAAKAKILWRIEGKYVYNYIKLLLVLFWIILIDFPSFCTIYTGDVMIK